MHHVVAVHVVESAKKLIRVQFDEQRMDLLPKFLEVFLHTVDVRRDVVHHDVKQCLSLFFLSLLAFLLFLFFFFLLLGR